MQIQIHAASSVIALYLHLYANAMACQCEQRENARRKKFKDAKYLAVSICCCDVLKKKKSHFCESYLFSNAANAAS